MVTSFFSQLKNTVAVLKPFIQTVLQMNNFCLLCVEELLSYCSTLPICFADLACDVFLTIKECLENKKTLDGFTQQRLLIILKLIRWYTVSQHVIASVSSFTLHKEIVILLIDGCWKVVQSKSYFRLYEGLFQLKLLVQTLLNDFIEDECFEVLFEELLFICSAMLLDVSDEACQHQILQLILMVLPEYLKQSTSVKSKELFSIILLPIIFMLSNKPNTELKTSNIEIAKNIMMNANIVLNTNTYKNDKNIKLSPSGSSYSEVINVSHSYLYLARNMFNSKSTALAWLADLKSNSTTNKRSDSSSHNILLLSSLIFYQSIDEVSTEALDSLVVLCKQHPTLVTLFMPLLLYCLNNNKYIQLKLQILCVIPRLAVDKNIITLVLKVLLSFSKSTQLLPITIKSLTELWRQQPRVFPYLQELLMKQPSRASSNWYEILLAKVGSILQICQLSGTQYGKDLVVVLSNILEDLVIIPNTSDKSDIIASIISILIESLKLLCVSLVIDLQSIWKAVVLKVQSKNHPVILISLCSLLSAVPACVPESKEIFIDEVLSYLWFLVTNENPDVISAAFKSLACFSPAMMKIKYLPTQIRRSVSNKIILEHSADNPDAEYDPSNDLCPGYAYLDVLTELPTVAHEGFEVFLRHIREYEIDALPRGIGRKVTSNTNVTTQNEIADVLRRLYETSSRPGVLPGIAAGLLCCYEPKVHGLNADEPTYKHLLQLSERYKQTLDSLLHDFAPQPNDWHHLISAPKAWCKFMKNVYSAVMEGRKAELEISVAERDINGKEYYKDELSSIKFWARDFLTNQLRKASRGSPKVQGNSILALVGLANAVSCYEQDESLEEKQTTPDQFISIRNWLVKVADTIMVIFDGNFKPKSEPFQWCQQISSERSTASSLSSRCCAAIGLSEMAPVLLCYDTDRIIQMVEALKSRCSGNSKASSSLPMELHVGLGLGLILSRLFQEQFYDVAGPPGSIVLQAALTDVEKAVYDENISVKDGAIVAYGLAVSSLLLNDLRQSSLIYGLAEFKKLYEHCKTLDNEKLSMISGQAFYFALAHVAASGMNNNHVNVEQLRDVFLMIQHKVLSINIQSSNLHLSLGVLVNAFFKENKKEVESFVTERVEDWKRVLICKESCSLELLGPIKGIAASLGVDSLLFAHEAPRFDDDSKRLLKYFVNALLKILQTSQDTSLCVNTAQILGQLCLVMTCNGYGNNDAPQNWNYLNETSVLRVSFDTLLDISTKATNSQSNEKVVQCLLKSFNQLAHCRLPPVNWTFIFNSLLKPIFSKQINTSCVQFVIRFAESSSSLVLLLSSWLQTTVFQRMEEKDQVLLFSAASEFLSLLTNTKQRVLLEELPKDCLKKSKDVSAMLKSILYMWHSVCTMTSHIQSTISYVIAGLNSLLLRIEDFELKAFIENCPLLSDCVYSLHQENWRSVGDMLVKYESLHLRFKIEMLTRQKSVDIKDIFVLVDECFNNELQMLFFTAAIRLFQEISFLPNIKILSVALVNKFTDGQLSLYEETLFLMCMLSLSQPSQRPLWLIKPTKILTSTSTSHTIGCNILKQLAPYINFTHVSLEQCEKVVLAIHDNTLLSAQNILC